MDLSLDGLDHGHAEMLSVHSDNTGADEDFDLLQTLRTTPRISGPERWIASNIFALLLWAMATVCLTVAIALSGVAQLALAAIGAVLLYFGVRVAQQGPTRRRISSLLHRRFKQHGPNSEALKHFMGEPCLQAQALWLLTRWRRADLWPEAMQKYARSDVLFYGHASPDIEDALNFPPDKA